MNKVKNIFTFLKNYNELLNPIITEIDKQIWSYKLSNLPEIDELQSVFQTNDIDELKMLEIERPTLYPCPDPEGILIPWIDGEWTNINVSDIKYKETIQTQDLNDGESSNNKKDFLDQDSLEDEKEKFHDSKARVDSFENWIEKREEWLIIEKPKLIGLDLYNKLFELYADIKREPESVELVIGDGNITWKTEDRKLDHPVLFQKVKLEFNSDKPSFIIKCEELKLELYTPMLRTVSSINQTLLPDVIKEAETHLYHIADKDNNINFYKRLVNIIDENGKYSEDNINSDDPTISYDPILFLRKRNLGYSVFIENIIDYIDTNGDEEAPKFFKTMVGSFTENSEAYVESEDLNESGIDKDVLLTLPANKEQLKIIKYLENYGEVLVQGPPGTGKTHTIANLIGHLLSEGKNVLVTSHTEKALTVLKDKVIDELQSLCISLLSANSQKNDIDATLFEIDEKTTTLDLSESKKKINLLENQREELINNLKEKNKELIQIRSLDYKDLVFSNEVISPIDAAKFINEYKDTCDYIPGISKDDTATIPLTHEELEILYKSNGLLSTKEEEMLGKNLPELNDIPNIEEMDLKFESYYKYTSKVEEYLPKLSFKDSLDIGKSTQLLNETIKIKEAIDKLEDYQKYVLVRTIKNNSYEEFWTEVFDEYESMMVNEQEYNRIIFKNNYLIPEELISEDTIIVLNEIASSGKDKPVSFMSGLMKPKWKALQEQITNNKAKIERLEDYENVKLVIEYKLKKESIASKINKLLGEEFGVLSVDESDFESKVEVLLKRIDKSIKIYSSDWLTYLDDIENKVSNIEEYNELIQLSIEDPVDSMGLILENVFKVEFKQRYYYLELQEMIADFNSSEARLLDYKNYGDIFNDIYLAIINKDEASYNDSYKKIEGLYNKKGIYNIRRELLSKLETIAPDWKRTIVNRKGIHGECTVPENIDLAWKLSQLNNQINKINNYNLNDIQRDLNRINLDITNNSKKLAYEKAWFHKVSNTTDEQTQAIQGWRQTIRQIGKGTGKSAPMLLKKARELMPLCQTAIPVWIMPLNKVAENFQPEKNKFDVVIIDEASQADILALSALYLGKQIIVVGDDAQVSPSSVGIKTDEMNALIQQYLPDIPLGHLFNGNTSVYDMAKTSGFKSLMLTEHFRCLPEIIEFSNGLSYNNKIKPLRDDSGVSLRPALVPYRVPDGFKNKNKVNENEAEHIASLICSCIDMKEYDGKTIGVISLVGQEQAYEIDKLLQMKLDPKEYEDRKILCGTSPQFQGDERDIIFLSMIESPNENGGPVRLVSESGRNDMYRKRYNVAASRAKDQMWVVYSLNPEIDLKPEVI